MHQLAAIFIRGDAENHRDTPVTIDGHCERTNVFAYCLLRERITREKCIQAKREKKRKRKRQRERERRNTLPSKWEFTYSDAVSYVELGRTSGCHIAALHTSHFYRTDKTYARFRMSHACFISSSRTRGTPYPFIGCIIYTSIRLVRERAYAKAGSATCSLARPLSSSPLLFLSVSACLSLNSHRQRRNAAQNPRTVGCSRGFARSQRKR